MALDTQPLSRPRRITMLVVLLAFLAASIAFAQMLVMRRQPVPPTPITISCSPPNGFTPANESKLDANMLCPLTATINGGDRFFVLYLEPLAQGDPQALLAQSVLTFRQFFGAMPHVTDATLAGYPALQLSITSDDGANFALIRAAAIHGHFVAAIYHGNTPFANEDDTALNALTGPNLTVRARAR